MIVTKDIFWLAGLLEGEGWFGWAKGCSLPRVGLWTTDKDVAERAARIMGTKLGKPRIDKRSPTYKAQYGFTITNGLVVQWMMTLFSLMGERRKERIKTALCRWRSYPIMSRSDRGKLANAAMRKVYKGKPMTELCFRHTTCIQRNSARMRSWVGR